MSKRIKVRNPVLPDKEMTYLTSKYSSGTALTVKNNQGFADNDIVVAGQQGREKTESQSVSGVTGNQQVDLDVALKFSHTIDTPLWRSDFDKISIERKPSGGAFSEIAEGKVNIEWDELDGNTKVDVAAGVDTDTFRWRFYNSKSATYSGYSGELPGTGLTAFHAGSLIKAIRGFAKMKGLKGLDDQYLLDSLNRGQRRIDAQAPDGKWYFALTEDSDSSRIQSIAGTNKYDLPTNCRSIEVVQVLDLNSQRYNLAYTPRAIFDQRRVDAANSTTYSDSITRWTLLPPDSDNNNGYFGVDPTPKTDGVYFYRRYYRFLPNLTSFSSKTLITLPEVLIDYVMFEIYQGREDNTTKRIYLSQFNEDLIMLKRLQRKQVGQAEFLHFRGQRGFANMYGTLGQQSLDVIRENYW